MLSKIKQDLQKLSNYKKAEKHHSFFKTEKGQYGEGDVFIGIIVPEQRKIAKKYKDADLKTIQSLLKSEIHEHRLTALFILVGQYEKLNKEKCKSEKDKAKRRSKQKQIVYLYLKNTKYVNNWDLVDSSAHKILGPFLLDKDRKILYKLAKSKDLWEKRIAIISTFAYINQNQFDDTLKISEILLNDKHDLIHKAVGWALREVGKKNQDLEEKFLKKHYKTMPRTMLRYAIEKFTEEKRKFYMGK